MDWQSIPGEEESYRRAGQSPSSSAPGTSFILQFRRGQLNESLLSPKLRLPMWELFLWPAVAVNEAVCHRHEDVGSDGKQTKVTCWHGGETLGKVSNESLSSIWEKSPRYRRLVLKGTAASSLSSGPLPQSTSERSTWSKTAGIRTPLIPFLNRNKQTRSTFLLVSTRASEPRRILICEHKFVTLSCRPGSNVYAGVYFLTAVRVSLFFLPTLGSRKAPFSLKEHFRCSRRKWTFSPLCLTLFLMYKELVFRGEPGDGNQSPNNPVYCLTAQGGRLSGLTALSLKNSNDQPVNKKQPRLSLARSG